MIIRITRPQLKKLILEQGTVRVSIGSMKNGIFMGGCYNVNVSSMSEAEEALQYAHSHGWTGKLYFGVRKEY